MPKQRLEFTNPWLDCTAGVLKYGHCYSTPPGRVLNSLCRVPPQFLAQFVWEATYDVTFSKFSHSTGVMVPNQSHLLVVDPEKATSLLSMSFPCVGSRDGGGCTQQLAGRMKGHGARLATSRSLRCSPRDTEPLTSTFVHNDINRMSSLSLSFDSNPKNPAQNDKGQGHPLPSLQSGMLDKPPRTWKGDGQVFLLGWLNPTTPWGVSRVLSWKTRKYLWLWGVSEDATKQSTRERTRAYTCPGQVLTELRGPQLQQGKLRKAFRELHLASLLGLRPWENQSQSHTGLVTTRTGLPDRETEKTPARSPHPHGGFPFVAPRTGRGKSFTFQLSYELSLLQ